jgi:Flp pilus assembly protein TadG
MVEFALVLPVFLVIIFAIVDFGWALKAYITVTNSAREGARVAVVGATDADIKTKAVDTSAGLLSTGEVSVSNSVEQGGKTGDQASVTVTYDYHYITPLGGLLSFLSLGALPDPLPMTSTTTMRIE